ncbi:TetR/AcrR family transcriptional regulator [Streptomyces beihaiensis]|uniref:TetR/AcrR family transcriptional regulator n=1 Tax=Streptomyces beihaiensis TaxID=2984495 RepID=A0ABT3TUP7_9ACTN|nr:TetR/AcrR family transcriptional regulator [Streptomyces beihaiensis]MCX3060756.1 TetR/AcrR family transcriptional regulator [Streptomyces beihaiensis]
MNRAPEHRAPGPGTLRPGGRTARVRAAVLDAVGEALAEHGFDRLDLADIARRAEVGRTTVYRRWGSPAGLVADLLAQMTTESPPRTGSGTKAGSGTGAGAGSGTGAGAGAGSGSLHGDLSAGARLVRRALTDARQGPLFRAAIAAATCDRRTADALRRFCEVRVAEWAPTVEAAVARGELPVGTDAAEVVRAVSAPLYHRMLTTGTAPTEEDAARAVDAAVAAAAAGVYVSRTSEVS